MPDQTISLPLKEALPSLRSPDGIHRLAMSFLPDLAGASRAARADLGVLYRLALPTDPGGRSGHAVLRFRAPFEIDGAEPVDAPEALAVGRRFTVRVVAEKRREDDEGRSRSRFVLDEEADAWVRDLLARRGIGADDLVVSERWRVGPPGGRAFWLRDLTATVGAIAEDCEAYTRGIGRGKAFGYGMPIIL